MVQTAIPNIFRSIRVFHILNIVSYNYMQGCTKEQTEEFKELFDYCDKDKDGLISAYELSILMRSFGIESTEEELLLMMEEMDLNIDSVVDFDHFLTLMTRKMNNYSKEDVYKEAFSVFSKGKTFITKEDLRSVLVQTQDCVSEDNVAALFARAEPGQ